MKINYYLEWLWNYLNSPSFPLTLAIIGVICFAVIFYFTDRWVNKRRQEIQQKLIDELSAENEKKKQKNQ